MYHERIESNTSIHGLDAFLCILTTLCHLRLEMTGVLGREKLS
jgi:hypothetical protein